MVENPWMVEDGQYFLDKVFRLQSSPLHLIFAILKYLLRSLTEKPLKRRFETKFVFDGGEEDTMTGATVPADAQN